MLARPDTKVRGRFCVKRCGPSRRRVRTASAVLKNFVRQPEKTFSTVSALFGRKRSSGPCRLVGVKQTSSLRVPRSVFYPRRTTDHLPRAPWIIASGGHRYCWHIEKKIGARREFMPLPSKQPGKVKA